MNYFSFINAAGNVARSNDIDMIDAGEVQQMRSAPVGQLTSM
jgi:hypothetical protein